MTPLTDTSTTAAAAEAQKDRNLAARLDNFERNRPKAGYFVDTGPTGFGNPPKPDGAPPNGTIVTGYYPNKTAGFRTWRRTRANNEWWGVNASA